jgi:gamma-glutamylcyclotransferase (GGCT)/AIG2-like uncharacterized protein YtfP
VGVPIFIYGTLLDPRIFARFAGRAPLRRALPARLAGWRRVGLRGTPYPTLARGPGEVAGLLLPRLAPAAFARLSAYEGACYALAPVRVATPRGARRARAWIAADWRATSRNWDPAGCIFPFSCLRARM